jgi:hypothetical protein
MPEQTIAVNKRRFFFILIKLNVFAYSVKRFSAFPFCESSAVLPGYMQQQLHNKVAQTALITYY